MGLIRRADARRLGGPVKPGHDTFVYGVTGAETVAPDSVNGRSGRK